MFLQLFSHQSGQTRMFKPIHMYKNYACDIICTLMFIQFVSHQIGQTSMVEKKYASIKLLSIHETNEMSIIDNKQEK